MRIKGSGLRRVLAHEGAYSQRRRIRRCALGWEKSFGRRIYGALVLHASAAIGSNHGVARAP